jgi:hypothetical protein
MIWIKQVFCRPCAGLGPVALFSHGHLHFEKNPAYNLGAQRLVLFKWISFFILHKSCHARQCGFQDICDTISEQTALFELQVSDGRFSAFFNKNIRVPSQS